MQMSDVEGAAGDSSATVMDRRALLRASGVVAGIAGIGGYAAAKAPAAGAAAGDPILMGAYNQAGTASTLLVNNEHQPTLFLVNEGAGAPLRLAEHAAGDYESDKGDLMNFDGDLRFAHDTGNAASVYTSHNAAQLFPVTPFRAVDTRTRAGRANIANRTGNLDSAGRLIGGHTIEIDLADYVHHGRAVYGNVTVTQPVAGGYLTVWPGGSKPGTSTLNYSAGQTVANLCVSGLYYNDVLHLYVERTTHVLLDIVAFVVGSLEAINPALSGYQSSSLAGPARKPAPAWYKPNG
jgi:hypothetical protein